MFIEPKLWDGSFYPISLHSSIEYLASDSKNIRDSLNHIIKYISNKQINPKKSNNIEDLKDIGKAIWNLIFSVYLVFNSNNANKYKLVPASIKKLLSLFLQNHLRKLTRFPNSLKILKKYLFTNLVLNGMCRLLSLLTTQKKSLE